MSREISWIIPEDIFASRVALNCNSIHYQGNYTLKNPGDAPGFFSSENGSGIQATHFAGKRYSLNANDECSDAHIDFVLF